MEDLKQITEAIVRFRDERDWAQFHTTKNLSLALSIEASELNELFLSKDSEDSEIDTNRLKEELADVLIYALLIVEKNNLSIENIIEEKLSINRSKYPVNKSKGSSKKYNKL